MNKDTTKPRLPELLAPAGTVEGFRAAIDSGANAVYLGLTDFNARLRARNFTAKTLSYAVPYAHARGVRVYVTFNTLVKQAELGRAVDFLYQLAQIGVDAVIVQDLGIARIAAKEFPRLRLHASTQVSVHNGAGVEACRRLGFRRVVLARELTLVEINKICAARGGMEIEVFVHGALCYSLSGMCLASSFFGGASGNRGRCTQVCRRTFDGTAREKTAGYFFSPDDFSAVDSLPALRAAGVASLKIEGRMKSARYVGTVTSAFRLALDEPEKTEAAGKLLVRDMGRGKTRLFLGGVTQEGVIDPLSPSGTGIPLGRLISVDGKEISVATAERPEAGDLVRVHPKDGTEGLTAAVESMAAVAGQVRIVLDKALKCAPGDSAYLVGSETAAGKDNERFDVKPVRYDEHFRDSRSVLRRHCAMPPAEANRDRRLFVKIDSCGWLEMLDAPDIGGVICAFDENDVRRLTGDAEARKKLGRAAYVEPPPFIGEAEFAGWREIVRELCAADSFGLMTANLGHVPLAAGIKRVRTDYQLWCLNRAAQAAYRDLGMRHFAYSLEDDSMNIRDCASQNGMVYLFTHAPLFVSRIRPAVENGARLVDRLGRKTFAAEKHGLYYLVAEETVSLFHKRERLEELGIKMFCVDLSFMKPDKNTIDGILACYREGRRWEGSCLFNFKGGLK